MKKSLFSACLLGAIFFIYGCAGTKYTLFHKQQKQRMELIESEEKDIKISANTAIVKPDTITQSIAGVKVTVEYLSPKQLDKFFKNRKIFGSFAGLNPYPLDLMVFYVKISNQTGRRIYVDPSRFVLIDNLNRQYAPLSPDYIISMLQARSSVYSVSKTTSKVAPGGMYSAPVEVATTLAGRGFKKRLAILKIVELTGGYIYNSVTYDGHIVFNRPETKVSKIELILPDIKTSFDLNEKVLEKIEFKFDFNLTYNDKKN